MTPRTSTGPIQLTVAELSLHVGEVLGHSAWHVIEQADANAFGAATHDEQWIHTDPRRAAQGPFGRTIAHGYLTLSLATWLVDELFEVPDAVMVVNYGVDRVRFPAPLPLGAAVRAEVGLNSVVDFGGGVQASLHLVYEVAGQAKPCCVADVLMRYYSSPLRGDDVTTWPTPGADSPAAGHQVGLFEESDAAEFGKALAGAMTRSVRHPGDLAAAGVTYANNIAKLGPAALGRLFSLPAAPEAADERPDKRFADAAWTRNPAFFVLRGAYLAACRLGDDVLDAGSKNPAVDAKARLAWQLLADALAPTNFLLTNPVALRRAAQTGGRSLVAGLGNFGRDLTSNGGKPRQVDNRGFEIGVNLAATAGKVVFRNDLMELIQYAPQTEKVHAVPLLAVPPWINKYYVMDLAPGRSLVEWAIQHERTVFMISYRNADDSQRDVTMDDYLTRGPLTAVDVIADITGAKVVDLLGLCIGGAMAAITAAYLAQRDPDRVGTLTLLNTLLDYSDPGALGVFTDERSVARLEHQMARTGFLEGDKMAGAFDALRPNDLIFGYVVSNWLLGEDPPAFDILSWNADSPRIPGVLHGFYLRSLYVENQLMRGELELAGRQLKLVDITAPVYVVGAVNDHIVPWTASYQATQLLGGDVRYVLSNGGHIAGVVNPPGPKAWFLTAAVHPSSAQDWRGTAPRHDLTWWEDWAAWGSARAGSLVAPPEMGSAVHPPLGDAPGDYIRS